MAAIVVPCGRLNIAITLACLDSARVAEGGAPADQESAGHR
jgi:hypothetical protein